MPLSLQELASIIKAITGWSDEEFAAEVGTNTKYLNLMRRGKLEPRQAKAINRNMVEILKGWFEFPWCAHAEPHIFEMMHLIRKEKFSEFFQKYGFTGQVMFDHLVGIRLEEFEPDSARYQTVLLSDVKKTPVFWGEVFMGFYFVVALDNPRARERSPLSLEISDEEKNLVYNILLHLLGEETDDEEPWKIVLRGKVMQLLLAAKWNRLDPKTNERASSKMRNWVKERSLQDRLLAYNDFVPDVFAAPFAALAVASRFRERILYPEILLRLQKQNIEPRFKTLSGIIEMHSSDGDKDFDEDFDDFVLWAQENPSYFEMMEEV